MAPGLFKNGQEAYERGQASAKIDLATRSVEDLKQQWEACQCGDDYDRGYIHTLNDHERKTNGSV